MFRNGFQYYFQLINSFFETIGFWPIDGLWLPYFMQKYLENIQETYQIISNHSFDNLRISKFENGSCVYQYFWHFGTCNACKFETLELWQVLNLAFSELWKFDCCHFETFAFGNFECREVVFVFLKFETGPTNMKIRPIIFENLEYGSNLFLKTRFFVNTWYLWYIIE